MNRATEYDNGIRRAEATPRMPAGAADDHLKTPAAERFRDNRIGSRTVEHHAEADGIFPFAGRENVAHAPQVPLAFFTDVADEQERLPVTNAHRLEKRDWAEQLDRLTDPARQASGQPSRLA